jgi:hypothetical protein
MAVQSLKISKLNNSVNNEQSFFNVEKVENWWLKPSSKNHKEKVYGIGF